MGKRPRLTRISEEKNSNTYPGYPYYTSSDDAINKAKSDDNASDQSKENKGISLEKETESLEAEYLDSENEVSKEDLIALGPEDLSMDGGDDELLVNRTSLVDFTGND